MSLPQLTPEQVRTWTLEQKDRWWLENVYKGDMPQLTLRSAITGFLLGGVLSATNLYVGAKTGWTLGVGITSVILAFAMYKVLAQIGLGREFTLLENNCMQSIATSAGYMTAPLVAALPAYMLVTEKILPWAVIFPWIIGVALLGVLFAFPLKKRFINDEQHPFPEGRACGVVLHTLHSSDADSGIFKAKLLAVATLVAAFIKFLQSGGIMEFLQTRFGVARENVWTFWHYFDQPYYWLAERGWAPVPGINGVPITQLTIRPEIDLAMIGAGGLMGIRTGVSLLLGAIINYAILSPLAIGWGDIQPEVAADGSAVFTFKAITKWALWGGVAMMTVASLVAFFAKPQVIFGAFAALTGKKREGTDVLKHIELPMIVFVIGIPIIGAIVVFMAHQFFGVKYWHGIIAVPLVFIFTLIGVNSTALTGITPGGALGKLTQLTFGAIAPGNIQTNIASAAITSETALNASNLLMDIKPGYMLGAKPRQQAIGHVIGIFAGGLAAVPLFNILFLRDGLEGIGTPEFPMPGAIVWESVARLLTAGLDTLAPSAAYLAAAGAITGLVLEVLRIATRQKFPLSPVAMGLAFVIPFTTCFAMFLGSFIFWAASKIFRNPASRGYRTWVDSSEPISAGIIAGAALVGIADALVIAFLIEP
jgi:uncharacterized oligopeptide transporter (OPT) family protein